MSFMKNATDFISSKTSCQCQQLNKNPMLDIYSARKDNGVRPTASQPQLNLNSRHIRQPEFALRAHKFKNGEL